MSTTHCYYTPGTCRYSNIWFPCGPVNDTTAAVPCCQASDTCMSGGLCSYTHSLEGGSGWYTSGCSDPTFDDPHCTTRCVDNGANGIPDVVQVSELLWACCGLTDDGRDCASPSNETFGLAASSELFSYFSIPATGYSHTSVSLSSSATTTSSTSLTSSTASTASVTTAAATASSIGLSQGVDSHSNELSKGSIAGIVTGIGAAVLLVAAACFLFLRRRRRGPKVQHQELDASTKPASEATSPKHPEMEASNANMDFYQANHGQRQLELPADREPGELAG